MVVILRRFWIGYIVAGTIGLIISGNTYAADSDADVAAIKRLVEQAKEAYIARDWERFANFFTEDGVWMPPNSQPLIGKDAWWSMMQWSWDRTTIQQMDITNDEIVVAGDWAFERHKEATTSIRNGESRQSHYKGVWILRRQQDDSWKIARYIWNQNPAPDAEN